MAELQQFLIAASVYLVVIISALLVWYIIQVIALWRIFSKAGVGGWKAIIPLYNEYTLFKISFKNHGVAWAFLILTIANFIISCAVDLSTAATWNTVTQIITFVIGVLMIIRCFKLSKAFGHGIGFGFGLLFLNSIFRLILGFSSDPYVDAQ